MHLLPPWQQTVPSRHTQRSITLDTPSLTRAKNFQHKWQQAKNAVSKAERELAKAEEQFKQLILEATSDNRDRLKRRDPEMAWIWHHLLNTCGGLKVENDVVLKALGMTVDEARTILYGGCD